jgi:hypothetical protein
MDMGPVLRISAGKSMKPIGRRKQDARPSLVTLCPTRAEARRRALD